jgi:hypothetical protein
MYVALINFHALAHPFSGIFLVFYCKRKINVSIAAAAQARKWLFRQMAIAYL